MLQKTKNVRIISSRSFQLAILITTLVFSITACNGDKSAVDKTLFPANLNENLVYINSKGETVITPNAELTKLDLFYGNRAKVESFSGIGFIDKSGKLVIELKYKDALYFTDGLAWTIENDGYPIAIDEDGNNVIEIPNANLVYHFNEGYATVSYETGDRDYKWGLIDKKGTEVIAPKYNGLGIYSEGLIAFRTEKDLYGYMDKNEKIVIVPQFEKAEPFAKNGYAVVSTKANDGIKKGVINKKGEYVVKPLLENIMHDEALFLVQTSSKLFGWMNTKDQYVINPIYTVALPFAGSDLAAVSQTPLERDMKTLMQGYIDKKGKEKIKPQFEFASIFVDDVSLIKMGDKFGLINKEGSIVVNPQYTWIIPPYEARDESKSYSLRTDYFDYKTITDNLFSSFDEKSIRGFSGTTTFKDLKSKYGDKLINRGNRTCYVKEEIELSKDASIVDISFEFDQDLATREYNYYSKTYETTNHDNASLKSLKIKIEMKRNTGKLNRLSLKINQVMNPDVDEYDVSTGKYALYKDKMKAIANYGRSKDITLNVEFE